MVPVAYTNNSGVNYVLYGRIARSTSNSSQVWDAAAAACQGISGNLSPITSSTEQAIVTNLYSYFNSNGGVTIAPATQLCVWLGHSNLWGNGTGIDGSSPSYIFANYAFATRRSNNDKAFCTAVRTATAHGEMPVTSHCAARLLLRAD